LESICHKCYLNEIYRKGLNYNSRLYVSITCKGETLDTELRLDVLEDIIVEN